MERARVIVTADRMSAELQIAPGAPAKPGELRTAIAAAGVAHGIDDVLLRELEPRLADRDYAHKAVVARGTPAEAGTDGRVNFAFPPRPLPGAPNNDGTIDYRERAFLHPAATGSEVAQIVAPVPGRAGTNVLGGVLPPPPVKAATLRLGSGVQLLPDGKVVAARDGVVATPSGGIDVLPLYEHKGDVDLHSGNLHSRGSLLVTGDLQQGLLVEAQGDVAVRGSSFGGTITAGGSIELGLGAQAGSTIEAGGDVRCRHATNSRITACGSLVVRDEIVHCEAVAARIELLEGRGHALGGALRSREHTAVLAAGSNGGAPTLLTAADLTADKQELVRRTQQADRVARQMQKQGNDRGPQRGGKLGRQHMAASDAAVQQKLELARQQKELLRLATVEIRGIAHAGTRIQLGAAVLTLTADCSGVSYRWDQTTNSIVTDHK